MDLQAFTDPSKPQFVATVFIGLTIGVLLAMVTNGKEKGKSIGESLEPFTTIFLAIGWIFKGIGFLIVFIIALFRREAPSFSRRQAENKTDYSSESDDSEDEEGEPRKRRKIDEYHV